MNVVVADACPIIFLAKVDKLALILEVFPGTIRLPASVQHELTRNSIPPDERRRIQEFLKHCHIETVKASHFPASALSLADRHVLTLAAKHKKSLILTDDSLVRRIATAEGVPVAGTLGTLIRAVRANLISGSRAVQIVDALIAHHQLRISVELYQETLRHLHR